MGILGHALAAFLSNKCSPFFQLLIHLIVLSSTVFSATPLLLSPAGCWYMRWVIRSMVDGSWPDPSGSNTNNGTRLVRAIQNFQIKLNSKLQELRKGLVMKVLFFLLGFYCAAAFATVIGQTGDWDILFAGIAVVVVKAIGALMYRASFHILDKLKSLIAFFSTIGRQIFPWGCS
ncbi:uncharacterized protein ycf20-like [Dioscorea cayenensis subsp. rotundata]|uniref:Uncharacterized protein ycf20-like n=1 Tax=Dioscorea cayennensis subsp. rotundata TaxID=55577 RepID=A0AB40CVQ3_DIOCR|nr:uncharacterized protein ycf20-like [Dioscorea cayenensis subsp. rotundata]